MSFVHEQSESESDHALYFFWLRFISSVCGFSAPYVNKEIDGYKANVQYNLQWSKDMLINHFNSNPFVREGVELPILIAVDEFSKLCDDVCELWTPENRRNFIRALSNDKSSDPIVRFVFTGFNQTFTSLLEESGTRIMFKSLSLCDFSSAKPLLKLIVSQYQGVKVPMLLFETVKSTPGLVGLWAERVFKHHFLDTSLGGIRPGNTLDIEYHR